MEVPGSARFLIVMLATFLLTVIVLGGGGYAASQITVAPMRDVFRAAAFEFDLAPGWWCELDGSAYVCSPPGKPPYAATVIMAMKERNEQDNLKAYEAYLKQPKKIGDRSGGEEKFSEVRYVRRSIVGAHEWVEALHSGSELPIYDTYYLATNTSYLGILVTLSVDKDYSKQYVAALREMIATLHIYQR